MSINWVMLDHHEGFVRLPGERIIYKSSSRTALALTTPANYPAHNPLAIHSSAGTVYLTNQRIVYLPETSTEDFKSFSAPLLNLHDSHIIIPWFGPNAWQSMLQPVPGGNIPAGHSAIELKLTFKDGGASDFHSNFESIKERLQQVVETARDRNLHGTRQDGFLSGVNLEAVHLDQLPSYEDSGHDRMAPLPHAEEESRLDSAHATGHPTEEIGQDRRCDASAPNPASPEHDFQPPPDAPPGYEETQQQSIQAELDRRLSP